MTGFLLARIAEDEDDDGMFVHASTCRSNTFPNPASWDPGECDCGADARRVAECEAKRRIVEASVHHARYHDGALGDHCRANLALLAGVYTDHPDYREEWRP